VPLWTLWGRENPLFLPKTELRLLGRAVRSLTRILAETLELQSLESNGGDWRERHVLVSRHGM
jgi:hypothetical protein